MLVKTNKQRVLRHKASKTNRFTDNFSMAGWTDPHLQPSRNSNKPYSFGGAANLGPAISTPAVNPTLANGKEHSSRASSRRVFVKCTYNERKTSS